MENIFSTIEMPTTIEQLRASNFTPHVTSQDAVIEDLKNKYGQEFFQKNLDKILRFKNVLLHERIMNVPYPERPLFASEAIKTIETLKYVSGEERTEKLFSPDIT
ncbi:MAG: hypothetical protein V4615_17380, partial [Bacteroidota bacterium]